MTDRCRRVLELALREALQLGMNYVAPEHLLLAIEREGENVGAQALKDVPVRKRVLSLLRGEEIQKKEVDNEMVVGVKRIAHVEMAEPGEPATGAANAMWVTIGGIQVPGLISATRCETDSGFMKVSVDFICSGYRTTDWKGPEAPESTD